MDYAAILSKAARGSTSMPPPLVLIYGEGGEGKTTFAAGAPAPVFLAAENGARLVGKHAEIQPNEGVLQSWDEALTYARAYAYGEHTRKTIVVDSLDALEGLLVAHVVAKSGKSSFEKMGWGKEDAVKAEWRVLKGLLEHCRDVRGMHVIIIAHAKTKTVHDPAIGDYSSYVASVMPATWEALYNWVDVVGFARRDLVRHEGDNGRARTFLGTEGRLLYTERGAGFAAKQRAGYRLPPKLPLAWSAFADALAAGEETADAVRARIAELAVQAGAEKKAAEYVKAAKDDVVKLREIENGLRVKLSEQKESA